MTPADLIDGLTGSEVRQFALAALQAIDRAAWHRDVRRFVRDMQDCADLAERLALEPSDYQPISVETRTVRHVHVVRALTDEQREAIRREYVPRQRGGRNHGPGPSLKQLAARYGVSYTAARNAVREAA
jgi:transcriptional regulator of aromatic amino acid metabolism